MASDRAASSTFAGASRPADVADAGRRGWSLARIVGVACLSAALLFGLGFLVFVAALERQERDPTGRGDGIVALTGGAERIEEALSLLAKGYGSRLLITGVNVRTSRDGIRRVNAGARDLVDCCVDLDYRARDTVGNAAAIRRWARDNGFRSVVVVTSNYHLPRALAELDHALPEVRKIPYAVVPNPHPAETWSLRLARMRLFASEYAKFLAVWVRTRLPTLAEDVAAPGESAVLVAKGHRTR